MNDARPDTPGILAPPPVLYLLTFLLGCLIDAGFPLALIPPRVGWRIVGTLVLVASGAFARWAFVSMRSRNTSPNPWRPTTALSTEGPFRITRNPIYVAMTGLYLGLAILVRSLWPWLLLVPLLGLMQWGVILREERYLASKFGEEYLAFTSRVPRWLLWR